MLGSCVLQLWAEGVEPGSLLRPGEELALELVGGEVDCPSTLLSSDSLSLPRALSLYANISSTSMQRRLRK